MFYYIHLQKWKLKPFSGGENGENVMSWLNVFSTQIKGDLVLKTKYTHEKYDTCICKIELIENLWHRKIQ